MLIGLPCRRAGRSGRSARPARPALCRRPSTLPLQKMMRPSASLACSSSQTSNASTVPPGKKWPILRVRTTTSTRAVDAGLERARPQRRAARRPCRLRESSPAPDLLGLFAHRERGAGLQRCRCAASSRSRRVASSTGDTAKMSTVMKPDFRNFSVACKLLRRRDWTYGTAVLAAGKAVRVDLAVAVAGIVRSDQRHVAIGAGLASSADSRTSARPAPKRRWPASCRSR